MCTGNSGALWRSLPRRSAPSLPLEIVERIDHHKIRDWRANPDAINRMRGEIDDILFEIAEQRGLKLPLDEHDKIIDLCIEVAIANED